MARGPCECWNFRHFPPAGCTGRGEPAPCRSRVVLLGSVPGKGSRACPVLPRGCPSAFIRIHSLSSNWVHTPELAGRLRKCTLASWLHGTNFDVLSFLKLPWKVPWPRLEAIPPWPFPLLNALLPTLQKTNTPFITSSVLL